MSSRLKGAMLMVVAGIFFSAMSVFVRLAGPLPTMEKALFRNLITLSISTAALIRSRPRLHFTRKGVKFTVLRCLSGTLSFICNFYAIDRINLADANMLNKLGPFLAVVFSALLLGEKARPRQVIITVAAFLGSLLIVKPTGDSLQTMPTLVALLGGVMAGVTYPALRGATTNGVDKTFVIFAYSLFSCVVIGVSLLFEFVVPTWEQMLCLILCGICAMVAQYSITTAYTYAPARDISIYEYVQVLFSAIWGYLVFQQVPDALSFAGYAIVIGLAVMNFIIEKKEPPCRDAV